MSILKSFTQMNTWRVLNPFSRHGMFIKYTWWILLFCSPQFQHALFEYMNIDLFISICSCKLEGQKHTQYKSPCIPCLCTRTPHTCPNSHTHTHKRPGRDLTLCFSVNMTDREKAAGCCVDDACSHQSFNLFLSVLPAETLFFPPGPSVTQSYCLSLFVIHWHSF